MLCIKIIFLILREKKNEFIKALCLKGILCSANVHTQNDSLKCSAA